MESEILAIILCTLMFVVCPITWMLLKHQQKMAELIHGRNGQAPAQTDPMLLQEIMRLREVIAQQAIVIDNLSTSQRALESKITSEDLRQRIS